MADFRKDPIALLGEAYSEHGEVSSLTLLGNELVFLASPRGHEAFFRAPEDQLSQKEAYQFTVPAFGKGIAYDAEPDVMMEQIGFLLPALRDASMRTYAPKLAEEVLHFIAGWGESGELDLLDAMQELTTYSSSRCLLGQEFRSHLGKEFTDLYHIIEKGLNAVSFFWPNAPLPSFRRRDRARVEIGKLISRVVAERRRSPVRQDDMLQALIEAKYQDGRPLTDEEITGLLLVVVFAGHHTSSVTATWTGIELLRNPHTLAPIVAELHEVFANHQPVDVQAMRKCVKLEWAVKETLRLHPPLIMLMRKVLRDFEYDGFVVPRGKMLLVSPASSHRLSHVFPDPDMFVPERFGPGREEDKQPYAWIPFGGGKHRCMGAAFAMLQVKTVWATLLSRYEFRLLGHYEPDYQAMVVGPKQPARVAYRRRRRA
jgi:sterol 14-demethylase